MSLIKHILREELDRLIKLAEQYERELKKLPKGSLSHKKRNANIYIYRAYREGHKIKFEYVGRNNSERAKRAQSQREQRIKYQRLLREVKMDIKEIDGMIHGKNR